MKKNCVLLLLAIISTNWLVAQEPAEDLAQPRNIIGRQINTSGEVTKEYEASFSYLPDGKLDDFQFPEWGVSNSFIYEDDYLTSMVLRQQGTWPYYSVVTSYTYEEGRVKTEERSEGPSTAAEYFEYEYYDDGRLQRKTFAHNQVYGYSIYEYGEGEKTSVESHFWTPSEYEAHLEYRVTSRYDDMYALLVRQKDTYDTSGEITQSKRTVYTYTEEGLLEAEVSQTLSEGEWVNGAIHSYVYDDEGRVIEQQEGAWSAGLGDWSVTKRTVHEYSPEGMTCTVSFYKKSGDGWVWDVFSGQRMFFDPELKRQQETMNCFGYIEWNGSAQVNQFEFEMVYTRTPTYMSVDRKEDVVFGIFPNPGRDEVTIKAPCEGAVVRFYDMRGRTVFAKPFDFDVSVGTGSWAPGIYLWEIWSGTEKGASGKWIKE